MNKPQADNKPIKVFSEKSPDPPDSTYSNGHPLRILSDPHNTSQMMLKKNLLLHSYHILITTNSNISPKKHINKSPRITRYQKP